MKILNLKFKNINSLSGENEIDFTKPVFTNDGLFAITGKTGAGKSSILDAVSLALYGKTPRVEITGSENAVMTRGEKDCYSEIRFEAGGKIWKSSWKQEKTRPTAKNPEGNLKPVNRQIADANDTIIADQVRSCDIQIVDILGLTFEQFTKVILLAQGSFAAFLQADKNEKGLLLEQVTGTEIYAKISEKVFERNKNEQQKLENIKLELGQIHIFSEEELTKLQAEIAESEQAKIQTDNALKILETSKKQTEDLDILQKQIAQTKLSLPEMEERAKISKTTLELSEINLKSAKEEQEIQTPVFLKIRALETQLTEKEKLLKPLLEAIFNLEKSETELSETLKKQTVEFANAQKELNETQSWAEKNKKYEELVSEYSAYESENRLLVNTLTEINNQISERKSLEENFDLKQSNRRNANLVFEKKDQQFAAKTQELEAKKLELFEILNGRELTDYQTDKENIQFFGTHVKNLIEIENSILKNRKEISDFEKNINSCERSAQELSNVTTQNKFNLQSLENQIILLEENIKLTKKIQSLDQHRKTLKDGEPCPLCGAAEHPYALGNVPQLGEKETEFQNLKSEHQTKLQTLQQDEKTLTKLHSDKDNTLKNKAKEEKVLSENASKRSQIISEIQRVNPEFSVPNAENLLENLEDIRLQKLNEYKQIDTKIKVATKCENLIKQLRDNELPALATEKQNAEKLKTEAETALKLAEQHLKSKQALTTASQENYNAQHTLFVEKLEKYGVDTIENLKKCLENWNKNQKQINDLNLEISNLNHGISLNNKELENISKLLQDKVSEKQTFETERQNIKQERLEIFGEKVVETEENRLKIQINTAEIAKSNADKETAEITTELEKNRAIIASKEQEFLEKQAKKTSEKSAEELLYEIDLHKVKSDELSQKIGAHNQALKTNLENSKIFGKKLDEKEKQQEICLKWSALNGLIGAQDGKKYRNFAQALTFEHLIGLSNRQLQKMSDRYLLKRSGDASNPFELSVIDKFQNSEERTAQNLSGGEKFIVSLALALGLANMASKNMRIDTMFIDEGFGTLDSDYLDVALSALSNLQSEGKIIGVISHLAELKERIATHIEVIPSGNGHSKIQITS